MMDQYSPKHAERILKTKSNHKNFVYLVGLCTYCKMMHGSYNTKLNFTQFCSYGDVCTAV